MEITGKDNSINIDAYIKNLQVKGKKRIEKSSEKAPEEIYNEDKVILSPRAKEIHEAKKLLYSIPDIREEKVAALKKSIKNGTYKIDNEKIADKMLKGSLLDELL